MLPTLSPCCWPQALKLQTSGSDEHMTPFSHADSASHCIPWVPSAARTGFPEYASSMLQPSPASERWESPRRRAKKGGQKSRRRRGLGRGQEDGVSEKSGGCQMGTGQGRKHTAGRAYSMVTIAERQMIPPTTTTQKAAPLIQFREIVPLHPISARTP